MRDPSIENGQLLSTTSIVYAPEGAEVEIIPEPEPDTELTAAAKQTNPSKAQPVTN